MYGEGYLEVFLVSFPKCSGRFFNVLHTTFTSIPVNNTTFVPYGDLVLGEYNYVLDASVASEVSVDSILTASSFDALAKTFTYDMTMYPLDVLLFLFLVLLHLFVDIVLHSILSMAHKGYLTLVKTSIMHCNSVLNGSGVDETVLAPCVKVLMILHLAPM